MGSCELVFSSYIAKIWVWGTVVEVYVFLYFFCSVLVLVNGTLSDFFASTRGFQQGDPLSLLLFVFVVEALSRILFRSEEGGHLFGFSVKQILIQ